MATPATRLLLVRHGQSEWNQLGKWQGRADVALTDEGRRQAVAASALLPQVDAIWSSDLQRASHTAALISNEVGVGPVHVDERLRETDVGQWQGLTLDEIEAGWPGYLAGHRRPDRAEPLDAVVARMRACMLDIAERKPVGRVLVVTHAGVIRALRVALGATDDRFANLSGCWFYVHANGTITAEHAVHLLECEAPASEIQ